MMELRVNGAPKKFDGDGDMLLVVNLDGGKRSSRLNWWR